MVTGRDKSFTPRGTKLAEERRLVLEATDHIQNLSEREPERARKRENQIRVGMGGREDDE